MPLLETLIRSHSTAILRAFAVAGALALVAATGLRIDNNVERLMTVGDPARELDERAKAEFGNDEVLMVAFELGAPYGAAEIERLASISARVAALDGVKRVVDLSTTEDVRGTTDGLDATPLVSLDRLDAEIGAIRDRTRDHRLYDRLLVSARQDVFGMLVYSQAEHSNSEEVAAFTRAVVSVIDEAAPPWNAYYAGYPITAFEANRLVKRDLAILTPPALALIAIVLYGFTRRWFPIVLMAVLIGWTEVVAFAWLALTDTPLNVVVSAVPTILLAISSTYVIYAIGLLGEIGRNSEPGVALARMLFRPVLLSSVSTAAGFLSLRLIGVQAVGDFGLVVAVGIVAASVGTLMLLPAIVERFAWTLVEHHIGLLDRTAQFGVRLARRPYRVVGVAAIACLVALPGARNLRVHTDTLHYFAPDSVVRRGADFFRENLASGFLLNVVVWADEPGRALDPDVLEVVDTLAEDLAESPHVDRTVSMLDYFYLIDAALRPGETPRSTPGSREAAAQYMLLYESSGDPEDYSRYVNFERSGLAMLVSAHGGSRAYLDLAARVEDLASDRPPNVTVSTLGSTFLYSKAMDGLTRGMMDGLVLAAALIGLVMLAGLRSVRLAVIAAVPNLVPIALFVGVLGWLDVPLSMGTSLVGCIALGLAVDDTAHVLGHLDRELSLEQVYRMVGPALVLTTLALTIGFSALMLSEFESVSALGAATAATMIVALAADLILLPSLLALAGYRVFDVAVAHVVTPDAQRERDVRPTAAA